MFVCFVIDSFLFFQEGETPLICAAAAGSLDCVKILINAGAHVHAEDKVTLFSPPFAILSTSPPLLAFPERLDGSAARHQTPPNHHCFDADQRRRQSEPRGYG